MMLVEGLERGAVEVEEEVVALVAATAAILLLKTAAVSLAAECTCIT